MFSKFTFLAWLLAALAMVVLNGLFHGVAAASFFDTHFAPLGPAALKMADFRVGPVILLEFVLMFVLLVFITRWRSEPVNLREAMRTGALFYFATSATWNIGNAATFVYWAPIVTVVDVLWHTLTGLVAGWLITVLFNRRWRTGMSAI